MGRIITEDRKAQIAAARREKPEALGPMLAELVLDGHIPVEIVAFMMMVSEPTIYRWMYGFSEPRDLQKIQMVKRLMTIIRKAKRARELPLAGNTKERVARFRELVETFKRPAA